MIYIDPVTESDTWYNLIWNPCMTISFVFIFLFLQEYCSPSAVILLYLFVEYYCAIMPMFLTYSHILNLWEWVQITNFTCLKWKFLNCTLFLIQAIDHIINSAAKSNYMSAGQISVPIVFRGPNGAAAGVGAQHSQVIRRNLPLFVFGRFAAVDSLEYKLLRHII